MAKPCKYIWHNKWELVYEDEFGVKGFSGKSIDKNDMPKLTMSTMSYCFSTSPIEVFFYNDLTKEWTDEDGNVVPQDS